MIKSLEDAKKEGVLENNIYNADCLDIMRLMKDKCVDLVLTDPPYGMEYSRHIKNWKQEKIENDNNLEWLPEYLEQAKRVLKDSGSIYTFCSYHNIDKFKNEIEKNFGLRNILIWDKGGAGMGDLETTYGCVYEMCIYANKSPQKLNGKRDSDILKFRRSGNPNHPTEKPQALIAFLINKSSNPEAIILDPFLGSGTTAVAAKHLGRNFIGIEISEKYCEIARGRLRQELLF